MALLTREWLNVQFAKREWRGLPRLSAQSAKELFDAKRNSMKNVTSTSAITFEEIPTHEGKESIIPQTVPTPPTPETPSASVVGNDK